MAILVDNDNKVLVQGITGHQGQYHTDAMLNFGTNVVGGVTPGKGGQEVHGKPVFNTMQEAVDATGANSTCVLVPRKFALGAVMDAVNAGIQLHVVITEHIPVHDVMKFVRAAMDNGQRVIGPNCPGVASPGKSKIGILPDNIFKQGNVGVVSRSGTLTYEIVNSISEYGLGQSTCVGLGGDPVTGTSFIDAVQMFEDDPETKQMVLVGEIGGSAEEEAAAYINEHISKPVFAYIAGRSAPPGKTMGHAGAIVSGAKGDAASKRAALEAAGIGVAEWPTDIPRMILGEL
ncbi:MAG: succinate--CoA ligase subunit alpha [Thermoplasmata archaeon]|nr:MAG: succinate--CoA ligase subunit alpha [Thermoplasmata archaeon]